MKELEEIKIKMDSRDRTQSSITIAILAFLLFIMFKQTDDRMYLYGAILLAVLGLVSIIIDIVKTIKERKQLKVLKTIK